MNCPAESAVPASQPAIQPACLLVFYGLDLNTNTHTHTYMKRYSVQGTPHEVVAPKRINPFVAFIASDTSPGQVNNKKKRIKRRE